MTQQDDNLNRETVHALMKALGIDSVAELGRRSNIERTYLSRILSGDRPAQNSHILDLAAALKVPAIAITGPGLDPAAAAALNTEAVA